MTTRASRFPAAPPTRRRRRTWAPMRRPRRPSASTTTERRACSVAGDRAALGLERAALLVPGEEAAAERVGVVARAAERGGRHRRPGADAAVEDDGPVAVERLGLLGELAELDVARPGQAAGLDLVGLAH